MNLNAIIVGLGNIGLIYDKDNKSNLIQSHAKAIDFHPNFTLIGGIDPILNRRNLFEDRYKKMAFKKLDNFKSDLEVDLAIIATPTDTHLSVIEDCIKFINPKMILCEKPLSYDFHDACKIVDLCKNANIELFVNFIRRCDPAVIEIKNKIENNFIKNPVKGICWYSKGLYNNGSHFINLLEFWLGNYRNIEIINSGRIYNNVDPEPEFIIEYEKGSIVFRNAWEEYFSFYNIEIISESGVLKYEKGGYKVRLFEVENDKNFHGYKIISEKELSIISQMDIYQFNVLNQIYKNYLEESTTICKGSEALLTQKIIYLIRKKLRN